MTKKDKSAIVSFIIDSEVLWLSYRDMFENKCNIEATFRSGYIRIVAIDINYKEAKSFIKQVKKRQTELQLVKQYSHLIN